MEIMKLKPAFKDYIWGGNKLKNEFDFNSDLEKIAEAWMLSCHKDGENIILNGEFKNEKLSTVINNHKEFLGSNCKNYHDFPILIKFIDAKNDLSIQVHPDNEYALKNEHEYGKTECWYILDCEENSEIVYGFNKNISKEEFKNGILNNSFLKNVNKVKSKKGDMFFIEAGTLHAICKGNFLIEIQQNSNTTYRVYDYDRIGNDGKKRELHIEKALDVTKCEKPKYNITPMGKIENYKDYSKQLITSCNLFKVNKVNVKSNYIDTANDKSFVSVIITNGKGKINNLDIKKGDSMFIPANYGKYIISGDIEAIITTV